MKLRNLAIAAGTLALGLAAFITPSKAQGPMYDTVYVNLPYTVSIADKTLQPGDYVIKELPSQDKSRVLLIYSDKGMHFETSAMTIPAYDPQTLENTKVVLHHFGPDYYFDKVWIQGKNYGYEFPLPDSVKARQREASAPVSVAARYESTAATTTEQTTVAQNTSPTPTAAPTPAPEAAPAPASPAPTPAPVAASPTPTPAPEPQADRELPSTSAGWLMMLLSGGTLSSAGLLLRRKR
jgi:LPXTG-motif cell wall-anchored protein